MGCVADALEVGPKMLKLFGYDIVVSKTMAFFSMERCFGKFQEPKIIEAQLAQNLKILHSLKYVHLDIKPENTSYSLLRKKYVLIDFGMSRFIKEAQGEKTKTRF